MGSLLSRIETVPAGSLGFYPGNARRGDVPMIAESLQENDQYAPLVVQRSTRYVLAGNHTLRAALSLGWADVDVVFVDVDDRRARKIVLSANRTADAATYDDEQLAELLAGLDGDFDGTGWTEDDLAALLEGDEPEPAGGGDPDDTPEPPAEPVSAPGDLYRLGPHRLLCGDATNPDDLKRVTEDLGGIGIGIVYTDPPYGIRAVPKDGGVSRGGPFGGVKAAGSAAMRIPAQRYAPIAGDDTTDVARDAFALLQAEYPSARHAWWGANHYAASAGLPDASCWLIWDKDNGGSDFADCELAWTNHPGAVRLLTHMWNGMLRASERGKRVHPTQKPVALAEWAFSVVDSKAERGTVLDVFGGSGSTLIAAHRTKRAAAVIEMEPAYVDVIARRYEELTQDVPGRVLPDGTTVRVSFT